LIEITGDDIASLGDADLRNLIGLLCEADYSTHGLATKGITWGGHQDAADGGVDVAVRGGEAPPNTSSVPRAVTVFQVKKPDMPAAEIRKEICPKGVIRESIRTLIDQEGAYVIVCSSGSTTDTALTKRVNAMRDAVGSADKEHKLHLDFMDRGRVATWVRLHPSLVIWVRNKIERPLQGWHPYENWANSSAGIGEEYLLDDEIRLHDGTQPSDDGRPVSDGLLKIRSELLIPRKSVRLTGLSGVGKTRFVQALFDKRIGEGALNQHQVIYTDMSNSPLPSPVTIANQLVNERSRVVLVVDNCPPSLHDSLTKAVTQKNSTISLLTVEYDVRDDLPEETTAFRLEPASKVLIEKLLGYRFEHISQVDIRTIANESGGNARVALALANTVNRGDTLSGLPSDELFKRLFWQRHDVSEGLLISAQICSLVYSFDGESMNARDSELAFLASLAGKTVDALYRDIAELKRRDLVQSRGTWRAILPHAIANKLAKLALESIPKDTLMRQVSSSSDRLFKSFSRRLSYLHDNDLATKIASDLLESNGLIGKSLYCLSDLGLQVLKNIAPVSPEQTLRAIERAANGERGEEFISRNWQGYNEFVQLLRHLAFSPELFSRSVKLLCTYALTEKVDENHNSIRRVLKSLFYIYLSGTHAPIEARIEIINELVSSDDKDKQQLGFFLLDAVLEAWHFNAHHDFSFGARSRDFGYHPNTNEEVSHWFETAISACLSLALSANDKSEQAKNVFSKNLRSLWIKTRLFDVIEDAVKKIHHQQAWNDGWISVREIIRFDGEKFDKGLNKRVLNLEKLLRPNSLLEKTRTFALSNEHSIYDLEDDFDNDESASAGYHRVKETAFNIGIQVARDDEVLNKLLPEFVSTRNGNLFIFGKGLAEGSSSKDSMFNRLYAALVETAAENREIDVICGFFSVCVELDNLWCNSKLDELIDNDVLGEWFPYLQVNSTIDQRGIDRLHKALDLNRAEAWKYECIAYGRVHETIIDDELAKILDKILSKKDGLKVAIKILHMRFHKIDTAQKHSLNLMAMAHKALMAFSFDSNNDLHLTDYAIAGIIGASLQGEMNVSVARQIGCSLAKNFLDYTASGSDWLKTLNQFARVQPELFLDIFVEGRPLDDWQNRRIFVDELSCRENPLKQITDDMVLSWCEKDKDSRYSLMIASIDGFQSNNETEKLEWNSLVYSIIERAPDLEVILSGLAEKFSPMSWSGSRAGIIVQRAQLLLEFYEHNNAEVVSWAKRTYSFLQEEIQRAREWEENSEQSQRIRNESFE